MRLLVFAPTVQVERLRGARPDATIHTTPNTPTFLELARRSGWDLIIVDPELAVEANRAMLFRGLTECMQPLLIYTFLGRVSAQMIAGLSAHCMAGVVLRDYDDSPDLLRNALSRVPVEFFGAQIVNRLGKNVDALPAPLRKATLAAFCSSIMVRTAAEYAANSGLTRRSVDRRLQLAGLKPAKWIVSSAQFLRAYPLIMSDALPITAVSRMTGYGSPRGLRASAQTLTGKDIPYLRRHTNGAKIVDMMEDVLRI